MYIILRIPRGHTAIEYEGQFFSRDIAQMKAAELANNGHEDELYFVVEASVFNAPEGTDNDDEEGRDDDQSC